MVFVGVVWFRHVVTVASQVPDKVQELEARVDTLEARIAKLEKKVP
jgi:BMFP domain-containing protein YqiC